MDNVTIKPYFIQSPEGFGSPYTAGSETCYVLAFLTEQDASEGYINLDEGTDKPIHRLVKVETEVYKKTLRDLYKEFFNSFVLYINPRKLITEETDAS